MRIFTLLILLLCAAPAFPGARFVAGSAFGSGVYLSLSRYADALPCRSSLRADARFDVGLEWDAVTVEMEVPLSLISASPVYDGTFLRSFFSLGGGLRFLFPLLPRGGIVAHAFIEYNRYPVEEAFLSFEAGLGPSFLLGETGRVRFSLETPVNVQWRKEIIGIELALLLRLTWMGACCP